MRHIFDNDTSELQSNLLSGQYRMTVQYRCGQCTELSPVWILFISISINKRVFMVYFFIGRYTTTRKEAKMECEKNYCQLMSFAAMLESVKRKREKCLQILVANM